MRHHLEPREPTWEAATMAVPWLAMLPADMQTRLDLTEWVIPSGEVARVRTRVELALKAHVMTYRREPSAPAPGRVQLCQVLACAELDPRAIAVLRRAEEAVAAAGVVLCAYATPLRLRTL
ncbi:hypothetical protein [Embleya sp. NPDC050493]|uniref:hypothetical protein n=1 Tax=Embleya sp. NPDC050493 TaxID=3363989 RepID=UPI00379002E4